jgi:hypothetical protein
MPNTQLNTKNYLHGNVESFASSYIIRIALFHHLVQGIQISFLVRVVTDSCGCQRYLNNGLLLGLQKWGRLGVASSFRLRCCGFFSFDSSSLIIRTPTLHAALQPL